MKDIIFIHNDDFRSLERHLMDRHNHSPSNCSTQYRGSFLPGQASVPIVKIQTDTLPPPRIHCISGLLFVNSGRFFKKPPGKGLMESLVLDGNRSEEHTSELQSLA